MPDETTPPLAPEKMITVQFGMNWDTGTVIIQATAQGEEKATIIQVPAQSFVEAAVSIGTQLLQRLNTHAKGGGRILVAPPGLMPGDLRRKH